MMQRTIAILLCAISWGAAAQHIHQHGAAPLTASAPTANSSAVPARACRKGAFTDAMALINSSVRASRNLATTGAAKSSIASAELDSILAIAISQASTEFECVKGSLILGYDKNFADTSKLAWSQARARNMAPTYIEQALQLSKLIELTGAPATAKK